MRWLALILLLPACTRADAEGNWSGSVETLPNGAVRVTNSAQGVWDEDSSWRLVPELVLGDIEGPEATVFGAVTGLAVDDAGRIYVLDRQANELRIFTPEGEHVRSVGRSGGGPGEYTNANGLLWIEPDTLLVVDQRGNRYTVLSREGEFVRTVPRGLGFYGWALRGGYDGGTVYELSSVGPTIDDRRPALLGRPLRAETAPSDEAVVGSEEGILGPTTPVDTVLLPLPEAPLYEVFSIRTERMSMMMGVPFAPEAVYRLDGRGSIWHGHGSELRILRSSLGGDTIMEILLDAEPAPVGSEELAEWEAGEFVQRLIDAGGDLDKARIPKTKPLFDDLYVDPDGYLWVSVPAAPTEVVFRVFDPEGRYLGRLQAEGMKRDTNLQPVVRNGRLHFVGRDELDVQRVYVFGIEQGDG